MRSAAVVEKTWIRSAFPRNRVFSVVNRRIHGTPLVYAGLEAAQPGCFLFPAADLPLLCSPVGTFATIGSTFGIVVCGTNHIQYTLDMVARDYLEDDVLYTFCRYLLVLSMISLSHQCFVEI